MGRAKNSSLEILFFNWIVHHFAKLESKRRHLRQYCSHRYCKFWFKLIKIFAKTCLEPTERNDTPSSSLTFSLVCIWRNRNSWLQPRTWRAFLYRSRRTYWRNAFVSNSKSFDQLQCRTSMSHMSHQRMHSCNANFFTKLQKHSNPLRNSVHYTFNLLKIYRWHYKKYEFNACLKNLFSF